MGGLPVGVSQETVSVPGVPLLFGLPTADFASSPVRVACVPEPAEVLDVPRGLLSGAGRVS